MPRGMFLRELATADAIPALEMTIRFAGQRQRVLAHNIANISTPDFQPLDLPVAEFQRTLGEAIDRRRDAARGGGVQTPGAPHGPLAWRESRHLRQDDRGDLLATPSDPSRNILFHDRNNRDTERMMQDVAENLSVYRVATDLLKSRYDLLRTAISGRIA